MALRKLYVTCAEGGCGAEVDVVEFEDVATAPAVTEVMHALAMDEDEARKLVAKRNPGAELSPQDAAAALAARIVAKDVPDRDPATYRCRRGHDGALTTTTTRPAPVEVFAIVQTPAEQSGDAR